MARYGPPDDPNYPDNDPTVYANYGDGRNGEPPGDPVPWYRKPAALVALGALGALLIALIVFGLAKLITGGDEPAEQTTLTPLTTTSRSVATTATTTATTSAPQTVTETVTPTTTETTTPTTEPTTTTTTEPSTSVSTSVSTSTVTSTVTETVTAPPPPGP